MNPATQRCNAPRAIARRAHLVLAIIAAALVTLPVASAHGWSNDGRCEYGEVCLFDHAGYTGLLFDRSQADIERWGGGAPLDGWAVNRVSSFANRTSRQFCLYAYERTTIYKMLPHEWYNVSSYWNDVADGVRVC